MPQIRTVNITRYITPLREGGSLPAIVEADDGFMYALKFRGAGQGTKALIADLIGAEIARKLGLLVPELVFAELAEGFGRTEPDEEIQDLLKFSTGLNLGLHYLSGSITFDAVVNTVNAELATKIVWLDAFLMNIDRTARNTNMLFWNKQLWVIDHGASLYFHHNPETWEEQAIKPFLQIKDHVLLPFASEVNQTKAFFRSVLTPDFLQEVVNLVPETWIPETEAANKNLYLSFLLKRLENSEIFETQIENARKALI
ncbi:HipA family kinase [Lacihabitans soyangensis]|uniref:Aminotransferase class I and II n=1 Tax=Lacihabitans soyangensis TaxID=869394 RepID=A0AAE3H199_9BACT|nr:HipA family kinase [Lacihabitans soyangensis]MCP9763097.1 aminotransferase class I and II [Lacihabitans soyangensis]